VFGQYNSEGTPRRLRSFKKRGKQAIGRSRGGLTTKIHMVTASAKFAVSFSLSSGLANDSPQGMKLLHFTPKVTDKQFILMDRAYAGKRLRTTAVELGYEPIVPPKRNFKEQWDYDKELYKKRNEVERFFRRLKRFRRIFTRYDKLDVVFATFILFAMIIDSLV
jgi:transposase